MKILFLVDSFGKKMYANGICVNSLCEKFVELGHEVTVISQKGVSEKYSEEIGRIIVKRINPRLTTFITNYGEEKKGKLKFIYLKFAFILHRIKKIFMITFHPIISFRVIFNYYKLIDKQQADIVISVLNPIEGVYAGALYKLFNPKCYHVIYELDTITNNSVKGIKSSSFFSGRMEKAELFWYKYCDQIIHMNCHKKHYEQDKYLEFSNKTYYSDIPLLKSFTYEKKLINSNIINIVYVGFLDYQNRNPELILDLLQKSVINTNKSLILHFAQRGNCDHIIQKYMNTCPKIIIKDYGFIEKKNADLLVQKADILLSIGNKETVNMIPSKTFEYISTGKPVIHLNLNNDVSTEYLKEYSKALIINSSNSEAENIYKIRTFFDNINYFQNDVSNEIDEKFFMNKPDYTIGLILSSYLKAEWNIGGKKYE